ncbi:MAG: prepilin-type N-terminal cleavage/methylation domain-containing protein [Candidatus Eisenbacteria bacterium]|nr:prepilin-type N-terminal cleavage/methylation domain-containing protein [Candidatus Eisenbacteria bacterium]
MRSLRRYIERRSGRAPRPRRHPGRALRRRLAGCGAGSGGATLIEVLISIVVLTIVVAPVIDGFVRGRSFTAHRGEKRMALRLAERKVEQLLDAGYGSAGDDDDVSSVDVTSGSHPSDPTIVVSTRGDSDPGNDVMGDLRWSVQDVNWTSPGDKVYAKIIDVTVSWPQNNPRDSVTLTFILGQ